MRRRSAEKNVWMLFNYSSALVHRKMAHGTTFHFSRIFIIKANYGKCWKCFNLIKIITATKTQTTKTQNGNNILLLERAKNKSKTEMKYVTHDWKWDTWNDSRWISFGSSAMRCAHTYIYHSSQMLNAAFHIKPFQMSNKMCLLHLKMIIIYLTLKIQWLNADKFFFSIVKYLRQRTLIPYILL